MVQPPFGTFEVFSLQALCKLLSFALTVSQSTNIAADLSWKNHFIGMDSKFSFSVLHSCF
jgi:hypothetical protein